MTKYYAYLLMILFLSGCRIGPSHCIPHIETEDDWHANDSELSNEEPLELNQLFDDPLLHGYLERLVVDNYDIQLAAAKICEAYALRQMSVAHLLPFIDGRVAYYSSKPAGGILDPSGENNQNQGIGIPLNIRQQNFLADFDAIWEIDLFGRRRKEVQASTAYLCMQKASYQSVILTLNAEFAREYLELRRSQQLLSLVKKQAELLKERANLTEERLANGLDPDISVFETQSLADQALAEVPILEGEIQAAIYRLSVLLGELPQTLFEELNAGSSLPEIKEEIPVGFPSELLRRRPDIRYAEHQIEKATAEVGVAVAELFPRITLLGNFGYQNLHLGNTRGDGESWGYGGNLLSPLFHGGSLRANIRKSKWVRYQSFLSYEQTVLKALEEAESAIARYSKSLKSFEYTESALSKNRELFDSTQSRYDHGIANQLQLIERELNTVQAEINWTNAKVNSEIQLIALYKALGTCYW